MHHIAFVDKGKYARHEQPTESRIFISSYCTTNEGIYCQIVIIFIRYQMDSQASLISLPIELLHRVFDFVDAQTILLNIANVCQQLNFVSASYNRLKLKYDSSSHYNFKQISRLVCFDNVISLSIKNDHISNNRINRFIQFFGNCEFRRLRALSVTNCSYKEFEELLQHINTECPITLTLHLFHGFQERLPNILPPLISKYQVQKLFYDSLPYSNIPISWAECSNLEDLIITECTSTQCISIIRQCVQLQALRIKSCTSNNQDEIRRALSSPVTNVSCLKTLAIEHCSLSLQQLESLFILTPALEHLLIGRIEQELKSLNHGYFWERTIQKKLRSLKKFEFFFSYTVTAQNNNDHPSLESLIIPFRTSFWLEEKHWYISCDYVFETRTIRIYTTPTYETNLQTTIRYEIRAIDGIHRLTRQSINNTTDTEKNEVSNKFFSLFKT